ncbi:MAG: TerB family tellurite resistance protein, partial [Gammaproteobacteria bacterium]|nr:TerB family tellurite resistance protein [Gammaproteobacteria bacterium]
MISAIKKFFNEQLATTERSQPSDHQLHLAAAALLFEVSRSDYSIDAAELKKIRTLVESMSDLSESETTQLMRFAEEEAQEATSLHEFTTLINDNWALEQKLQLAEWLWQVVFADGHLDDHEVHLMRKIQRLLYLPQKPFIAAKA